MKFYGNTILIISILFFAIISCKNGDEDLQQIDQVVNLYIDSAGTDMLNKNIAGTYTSVSMNDVYGITDNAPISVNFKKTADTINYIEYIAGAKRKLIDSSDSNNKIYQSKIALNMILKESDTKTSTTNDTLTLNYLNSATLFGLKEAFYNNILVFSKVEGESNVIKIQK